MALKVSLNVQLGSVVGSAGGDVRVSFDCNSNSWADAVLSVSSTDATIVACAPSAVAKGKHSASGHVDIRDRKRSAVALTFRLEVPGGGGMAIVVRHVQTGGI